KVEGIVSLGNEADGVPTGTLENKAIATYNEKEIFDTVTNTPGDPIIVVNKVIKTLAGKPFEGQKYNSGDELVYEISVENSGAGMASDVSIKDAITTMTTELAGGLTGPAFSTWTIAIVKTKATTLIEPATVGKDNDINLTADIDRGDKVVITITATINPKAVGIIPKNVVTVGETEKETPKVDPEKGVIQFIKEIVKGKEYTQGGTIEYKLTITNPNKTFVNDVSFIDEISKIKATGVTEDQVTAFKSWTVKRTDNGTGSTYTQEAEITVDINDKIDISPNDVIVYTVTGVVNENVVGDIVNTGYVEYVGPEGVEKLERSVTSENVPGTVTIEKDPISPNYLPNGEIGFTVVVTNTSTTSVANNITVKDSISSILAQKVGGGTVPAFQTGWTVTAVLEGSEADKLVSNITALEGIEAGEDINAIIDLGKNTKVIITIKGTAANNIYGDILNIASFDYPEAKDEAGKTGKDEAVIKNTPSTPTLVKVVDKATYLSGETLEYTITIKNPGESIIAGFKLTDEIGKVTGEISGENVTTGPAFVSWSRLSLTIPDTSSLISETVKNSIEGDTYNATLDLAPGDEVVIKLTAVTKTNVFGELKNTAVGKYNEVGENGPEEKTLTSDAISTGKVGKLGLTKTVKTKTFLEPVSSYLYSPGEEVEYTITVSNNGEGWVRNAKLEDIFTDIKTKLYPTGELGAAMQSGTLSVSHVSSEPENSVTIVENNPNLVANIDIKNGSTITFTAKIKVSNDAVSFLTNIAVLTIGEGENKETIEAKATIFAQLPKVSLVKTVDIQEFNLSQKMIYTVVLENSGENNLIGIEGRDILEEIRAMNSLGEMVYPFEDDVAITRVIEPADSVRVTTVTGEDGNIFDNLDMRPKSKITYTIELKVKDNIVGNITNVARARVLSQDGFGEDQELTSTVDSNPLIPTISIEKAVITSIEGDDGIVNGEEVTYTIKIKTDRPVFNVKMIDEVVNLKTEAGATVFIPESIKLESVLEAGVALNYTGDINGTTSEIRIDRINAEAVIIIKAIVKKDVPLKAGEKIKNIVTANFDQANDGTPDRADETAEVDILAKAPDLEITKVAKQEEILLGEEVEYTVKVKNKSTTAIASAGTFTIIDAISKMEEKSINGKKIPAYTSWTVTGTTGPNSKIGTLPETTSDINISDAEIAPGDTLIYTIKAKTSLELDTKEVKNTAFI
ncbi:MAG: hypothetical protein ACRC34_01455, partial [Cetobacterium sp.]